MISLDSLYQPSQLQSRSVSFENPTGATGSGGQAASPLGPGRKGDPARVIEPGATIELARLAGPGTIRHVWMTTLANPRILRGVMLRAFWEGSDFPSLEVPLGEFFGFAHGSTGPFQSALHSVGPRYGMNNYLPMPFARSARLTLSNDTPRPITLFYQIDYTINDPHAENVGKLHGWFTRQNPTTLGVDFELLHKRQGSGRIIGTVMGIRPLSPDWWGEGEVKCYMDGDSSLPTIAGTGSEDYVGLSWGIQQAAFLYHGANRVDAETEGAVSMYRWHLLDPLVWHRDMRMIIQQIGHRGEAPTLEAYKSNLYERSDDWSAATYWYAPDLSPLPAASTYDARTADLPAAVGQT